VWAVLEANGKGNVPIAAVRPHSISVEPKTLTCYGLAAAKGASVMAATLNVVSELLWAITLAKPSRSIQRVERLAW
jgi:hypothetical protein